MSENVQSPPPVAYQLYLDDRVTWTEENIAIYLKDPKSFVPGNKMAFPGLKTDEEIADVIAYLKQPGG